MTMMEMYKGFVNSIETVITNALSETDNTIYVHDDTRIPDAPNLLVIGGNLASAETVKLIRKEGNKLTVERGFQGFAKSWAANTVIARNYTEHDHAAFINNILTLLAKTISIDDLLMLQETDINNLYNNKLDKSDLLAATTTTAGIVKIATQTIAEAGTDNTAAMTALATKLFFNIVKFDWSKITTGKPTTLNGYGIVDAWSKTALPFQSLNTNIQVHTASTTANISIVEVNSNVWLQMGRFVHGVVHLTLNTLNAAHVSGLSFSGLPVLPDSQWAEYTNFAAYGNIPCITAIRRYDGDRIKIGKRDNSAFYVDEIKNSALTVTFEVFYTIR